MLDEPLAFQSIKVVDINTPSEYECFKTHSESLFYMRKDSSEDEIITTIDILILPITEDQFFKNKSDYFYGIKMVFLLEDKSESILENFVMVMKYKKDIKQRIHRIRFYPDGKQIIIDRNYDDLYPPQEVMISGTAEGTEIASTKFIQATLEHFVTFYSDKKI